MEDEKKVGNMWNKIKIWLASSVVSKFAVRLCTAIGASVVAYLIGLGVAPETAKEFGSSLIEVLESLVQILIVVLGSQV